MGEISWAGMNREPLRIEQGSSVSVFTSDNGVLSLAVRDTMGATSIYPLPKPENGVRVEAKVGGVGDVKCGNVLICIGSVGIAEVQNCMDVEGTITNAQAKSRVFRQPNLAVEWGKRDYERKFPPAHFAPYKTPLIVRIETAWLTALEVNVHSVSCETLVVGEVKHAHSGNCMRVRGHVDTARAGNCIAATQKLPSRSRLSILHGSKPNKSAKKVPAHK